MENLALQSACFENIKTLCTNYQKDGASRKTEEYLNKRLLSLGEQWDDFSARHAVLEKDLEDRTIPYFAENIYGKTKSMYEATKTDILNRLINLRKPKDVKFDFTGYTEGETDNNLKQLLNKQEGNFKAIDRALSKINVHDTIEKWELEDHLSILKSKWEKIDQLHWELDALLKGNNENYYQMFVNIEDKYDTIKKKLSSKIWSTVHYQKSTPRIELPEFTGSYQQWISFKDLFLETIHNNPMINKAQKMQHLKTKLRGEAEKLVQHLTISADNYDACWDILNQRFDNRRLQFTSFMNTMLQLTVIQQPDANNLKKLHDVIIECMNGLSNIGIDTASWDPIIVHIMSQKLDSTTMKEYVKELTDHRELPVLQDFLFFLESKFLAYESIKGPKKENNNQNSGQNNNQNSNQKTSFNKNKNYNSRKQNFHSKKSNTKSFPAYAQCPLCNGNHVLMQCTNFADMNPSQRIGTVAKLQLCKKCLFSHGEAECTSTKTCKECNMRHHTLLHLTTKKNLSTKNEGGNSDSRPSTSTAQPSSNHLSTEDEEVLLTTAMVNVRSKNGTDVTLRALLDQGSQVNLISENAAQLLKLPRQRLNATISGIGAVSGDCKGRLKLTCKSIYSDYTFETHVLIMKKLTNNLPNSTFNKANWPHVQNLKLADPNYNISRPVDLLLGADVFSQIILDGVLKGSLQSPIAQQTHLGWILCGKLKTFNCHAALINIDELTKFWENEDITPTHKDISKDDESEIYYTKTTKRQPDGKYVVKMPLCSEFEEKIGQSKSIAISQFIQVEKRLERDNKLALMYRNFIKEYIDLGHMTPATQVSHSLPECYLPHHGVLRESSTTTKLRVVFNASQKTSSGYSLNSVLEKGVNLQQDIQALIMKWRSYEYAFTADIEKMYRCIWIAADQQALQKIIWRDSPTEPLKEYKLCTVTYGTKCAPWLAMRTLKQLALDDGHRYPALGDSVTAAEVLQNQFYMDDLISGDNSLENAKHLQKSLIELLRGGGMNLRKWSSNHPALLETLTEDQISTKNIFDFKQEESLATLGLGWNPNTDTFLFKWDFEESTSTTKLTKRRLLSEISKLYDPLGWMSPVTVTAKLLFQQVWITKVGWDEELPIDIQKQWLKMRTELPTLKNIKICRWIGGTQHIELLGFCDASEKAYSCVIYTRVTGRDNLPIVTLLASKTRVAPLSQKTTLPRLELCGALLLTQLMQKAKEALSQYSTSVQAWSDSQVVIAWLQGEPSRWEKYIANRVTKIKNVIPAERWNYVKSSDNPADCASRGLYPSTLIHHNLWWQGPGFLRNQKDDPTTNITQCLFTTNIGSSTNEQKTTLTNKPKEHFINELLQKYSSLTRVTRVMAWTLRFINNLRRRMKSETEFLTTTELNAANEYLIKGVQEFEFSNEIKQLKKRKKEERTLPKNSQIRKLNPYLDEKGIIRVGGRLRNSNLCSEMKNPIILSRNGRFTQLLINQAHLSTLHGGARLTLSYLRQRYWIVGGNRAVKTQLRGCVRCNRFKATQQNQLMSDLPPQRVTPSRPFTHTGVDFTGHIEIKLNKGRGTRTSKAYIAIFVCMATKAVHIELVSDLSTETFIAALQRLCARRGTPKHMYSDCGTNFVGAAKMLRKEFQSFKEILTPEFFTEITKMEIQWHFNAPAWPSAGGLWEAAVKSMKHHLRRVLGEQKLTYEDLTTLLTKIEACMNSRPLCPLTEDPEEFYNVLTPGHFLTGGPTMSLPMSDYNDAQNIDLRRRWQLNEHMFQQFWKNWANDYLTTLQARSKWLNAIEIKENDIVLIRNENLPPGKWAMGRVVELHPGSDGHVRVTTLKTQSGLLKRPIVKLVPLPVNPEQKPNDNDQPKSTTNSTAKPKQKKNKPKKKTFSTMFTTMLAMFTLITGSYGATSQSDAHITRLEPTRPIYYDTIGKLQVVHDEWTLLMYYNLSDYWEGVRRIGDYLHKISYLCEETDPRYCNTTLQQLTHEMELVGYYNTILLSPHKHLSERRKRGLVDGVGYLANNLFGILDQRFADKYHQDIKAIQNNENFLLELIKNQTSIAELENIALKKSEDNLKRQFTFIDNFMQQTNTNLAKIETELEAAMAANYFNSASFAVYLLINNLRTIQEMLFNTLTNVYKGHVDVHLLTPVILIQQLNDISGRLPKTLSLPVDNVREEIKDLYKLLHVKARITDSYFLFEIHIPLISDDDFLLYQAIPLPIVTASGTTITQLESNYVAINFEKNNYISINQNDLNQCLKRKTDNFLCTVNMPVLNLLSKDAACEAKLLSHRMTSPCDTIHTSCKDAWIKLRALNTWLTICCQSCSFRTVCDKDITSHTMNSSGIVTLAQGCILQTKDSSIIYSQNQYSSRVNMRNNFNITELNSSINKIVNISHYQPNKLVLNDTPAVKEIDQRLIQIKERENTPLQTTMSTDDIHQYIICYILTGGAITVLTWWIIKRRCLCQRNENGIQSGAPTPQYGDIELKPIRRLTYGQITKNSQRTNRTTLNSDSTSPQASRPLPGRGPVDNITFNFE